MSSGIRVDRLRPSGRAPGGSASRSMLAAAGAQSRAVENLSGALDNAGSVVAQQQIARRDREEATLINAMSRDAMRDWRAHMAEQQNALDAGDDASGFADSFLEFSEEWIGERLPEGQYREEFVGQAREHLAGLQTRFWANADEFETGRKVEVQVNTLRETLGEYAIQATMDPDNAELYFRQGKEAIKSIAGSLPAEVEEAELEKFGRDFATGQAEAILDKNPAAMGTLRDSPAADYLDASEIANYERRANDKVEAEREKAEREAKAAAEEARQWEQVDRIEAAQSGALTREGLEKMREDGDITPQYYSQLDSILDSNDKSAAEQAAREAENRAKTAISWRTEDLEQAIAEGRAGEAEIKQAREDGWLKPEKYGEFMNKLRAQQARGLSEAEQMARVAEALGSDSVLLDPGNADDKAAVDTYYTAWAAQPSMAEMTPEVRNTAKAQLVEKLNMIPEPLEGEIRRGMLGSPKSQAETADLIARLDERGGNVLDEMTEAEVAKAHMINDAVKAGLPPEEAVARATEQIAPENRARVEARRTAFKDVEPITAAQVADSFDTLFTWEADVPEYVQHDLENEANRLFQQHYELTGDEAASREYAMKQIGRTWGVSNINGSKQMMKYPPEIEFGAGGDEAWMRTQLQEEVSALGTAPEGEVFIESDARTARGETYQDEGGTVRKVRTWAVMVQDENGVFQPVMDPDGNPMRWWPDAAPETQRRRDESVADMRRTREAMGSDAAQSVREFMTGE